MIFNVESKYPVISFRNGILLCSVTNLFHLPSGNSIKSGIITSVKISIIAHPNSKKPRVEKDLLDTFHVYVSEPPLEGRANNAIVESLADYFKVNRNKVVMISGKKSKTKTFEIFLEKIKK